MTTPAILQLRIERLDVKPLVWRRLQVPGDATFWDLHVAIQSAFAWTDSHLHEFRPVDQRGGHPCFGVPLDEFDDNPPGPGAPRGRCHVPGQAPS